MKKKIIGVVAILIVGILAFGVCSVAIAPTVAPTIAPTVAPIATPDTSDYWEGWGLGYDEGYLQGLCDCMAAINLISLNEWFECDYDSGYNSRRSSSYNQGQEDGYLDGWQSVVIELDCYDSIERWLASYGY